MDIAVQKCSDEVKQRHTVLCLLRYREWIYSQAIRNYRMHIALYLLHHKVYLYL